MYFLKLFGNWWKAALFLFSARVFWAFKSCNNHSIITIDCKSVKMTQAGLTFLISLVSKFNWYVIFISSLPNSEASFIISVPIFIRVSSKRSTWLGFFFYLHCNLNSLNLGKTAWVQVRFTQFLFCWFHTDLPEHQYYSVCDFYSENQTPPAGWQWLK